LGIKVATTVGKALLARQAAKTAAGAAAKTAAGAAAKAAAGAAAAKTGATVAKEAAAKTGATVAKEAAEKVGTEATEAAAKAGAKAGGAVAAKTVASKIPGKWQLFLKFLEKKSPALFAKFMARLGTSLAGLAVPGPGWVLAAVNLGLNVWTAWEIYKLYKIFTGQSAEELESQELVADESSEKGTTENVMESSDESGVPENTASSTPPSSPASVRAYQRPNQQTGSDMDRESRQMYDGREDRKTDEIRTIVLPQQTPAPQRSSSAMSEMPVTIKVRNTDPSLSTYRASIFDHPVTHPGNYMI